MIRIAICDDNEIQSEIMEELLGEYVETISSKQVTFSSFSSGRELLDAVKESGAFDIYLLDIVMHDISGMEAAVTLRQHGDNGVIIFITSSTEYAVVSYDVHAFYYMLKPVDRSKLFKILDQAIESIKQADWDITVHGKSGDYIISIGDIAYVDIVNRVPKYHLLDGRSIDLPLLRGSFKQLSEPLLKDKRFAECGASMVINMSFIDAADSESILLRDGTQLYPPKSAWSSLKKKLSEYKH